MHRIGRIGEKGITGCAESCRISKMGMIKKQD
jgi:hypothetical protein